MSKRTVRTIRMSLERKISAWILRAVSRQPQMKMTFPEGTVLHYRTYDSENGTWFRLPVEIRGIALVPGLDDEDAALVTYRKVKGNDNRWHETVQADDWLGNLLRLLAVILFRNAR